MKNRFINEAELLEKKAEQIIEATQESINELKSLLPDHVSELYEYVYNRKLPRPSDGASVMDIIGNGILYLERAFQLEVAVDFSVSEQTDGNGMSLKSLCDKAAVFTILDFPEDNCFFWDADKNPLPVFSLEHLAEMSGRSIGTVRNLCSKGEEFQTVSLDTYEYDGTPVKNTVFVEYSEARRWLESKNLYEQLRDDEAVSADKLSDFIRHTGPTFDGNNLPQRLLLRKKGDIEVYYAPFEHVNTSAKIVLCGITPGIQQAEKALNTYASALVAGDDEVIALEKAKDQASFAGGMRKSLVKMMDHIHLNELLGIGSCAELFDGKEDLVHHTSVLRNPVLYKKSNYSGTPSMLKDSVLKWQLDELFAKEIEQFGDEVLFVALGPKPEEALYYLADRGLINRKNIIAGMPHPSGANAERIKYFCEEKPFEELSSRTNGEQIDKARDNLKIQINQLIINR